MEEIREQMGSGPVYISFDIDALDPSFAPGTGEHFQLYTNTVRAYGRRPASHWQKKTMKK